MRPLAKPLLGRSLRWPRQQQLPPRRRLADSAAASAASPASPLPSNAPRPLLDIRHIRDNPSVHAANCIARNYPSRAAHPARIAALWDEWHGIQAEARRLRHSANVLGKQIPAAAATAASDPDRRARLLDEARAVKGLLSGLEPREACLWDEMVQLALVLPNLTSAATPQGADPAVLGYINGPPPFGSVATAAGSSHVDIGARLGIIDFAAAAATSGWGWYFLVDDGALLEQALVGYALATAARRGWTRVSPPSVVYSHVASACGFQPRDQAGEQQIYGLSRPEPSSSSSSSSPSSPERCLAGTAEIPLAGMHAGVELRVTDLPRRVVAASRCYRAEAGSRGAGTRGLYRVHEFTKVEMFSWTAPDEARAAAIFDEMVATQTEILAALGLTCRILEMPAFDLGASAWRKRDIEAYFPSRGWGEVTSASICTDYQTRRLATRTRLGAGPGQIRALSFPWTVNGTALAVPRVLAALLEVGWDERTQTVTVPECLWPWMEGKHRIG